MSGSGGNGKHHGGEQAVTTLERFLADDGWFPERLGAGARFAVAFAGAHATYRCVAEILVEIEQLVFYVVLPENAPVERRLAVAEAITRANYGMRIGNFELDFSDGEVRYKSSLDFTEELLSPALIRNALYPAVETMDRYALALRSVSQGEKTPVDAIDEVEGGH